MDVKGAAHSAGAPVQSAQGSAAAETKPAEAPKEADVSLTSDGAAANSGSQSFNNAILSQRKVIRNANVTVEVDDFDIAYGKIKSLINAFGFIQETNIRTEKIYVDSGEKLVKKGIIVIRVDKMRFDDTLSGIKSLGLLVEESIKSDDVTEQYFDVDSRLRLLRFEESRLEDYLKKLTDPDTIFKTESRLTDIRHEIEGLTVTLRKWDDLVELSTITINLNEKTNSSIVPVVKKVTYWERLKDSFWGSFKGVVDFIGELVLFLVKALPVLALLALLAFLGVGAYRRFYRKGGRRNTGGGSGDTKS